jgi:hypothetical protein
MALTIKKVGAACGFAWLIVAIVLIAVSFATVSPHEYGLKYDHVSVRLDTSKVYGNGRWYVGLGSKFFKVRDYLSSTILS